MEPNGHDTLKRSASATSSSTVSRQSSTVRLRPSKQRSNSSLKSTVPATPIIPGDDHSLTSFPSLSPSFETSPELFSSPVFQPPRPQDASNDGLQKIQRGPQLVPAVFQELLSPNSPPSDAAALFDDAPGRIRDVPGTLHHQSDEHVERLIGRIGAVALVKQLAQDLAERDAQMTLFQRRAEEREALLRKMLRECEVSNLNIENRLRDLRKPAQHNATGGPHLFGQAMAGRGLNGIGTRPEASLSERLAEAFQDEIQVRKGRPTGRDAPQSQDEEGDFTTPRPLHKPSLRSFDAGSVTSGTSTVSRKSDVARSWKDYLGLAADGSQATTDSSTSQTNGDQAQVGELQGPLLRNMQENRSNESLPALSRYASHASLQQDLSKAYRNNGPNNDGSDSISSSRSVAGWVTKLVAGGTKNAAKVPRDRATTISTPSVNGNKALQPPVLQRVKSRNNVQTQSVKRPPSGHSAATALSNSRTVRRVGPENARPSINNIVPPGSSGSTQESSASLGPVEMDTILPEEIRPPTLTQYNNYGASTDYLTDRFGFIYDQRRRMRQNEAAAALPRKKRTELAEQLRKAAGAAALKEEDARSGRSRSSSLQQVISRPDTPGSLDDQSSDQPTKGWQDYLKLTNFRTELLSHTPYTAPITDITMATDPRPTTLLSKPPSQIVISKSGTVPAASPNPPPSPTRVVSDNAELATPAAERGTKTNPTVDLISNSTADPVKALLDQVNEVHDSLQREKTIRWNEFLRKVRAERRRDKEVASSSSNNRSSSIGNAMPETLLADGEFIGVAGLGVKGKVGRAKGNEFRNLVLNGIPVAYRAKIWAECCGASSLRIPGYYEELVQSDFTDAVIAQQIQMDITRTLTDNIFFRAGQGVAKLDEVLRAYARRNPVVGYCQGMNLITANLLLIMPAAEDAFWTLTSIVENILPEKYYDSSLLASRADQGVLRQYVAEVLPPLSAHFDMLGIDLEAVTFQWFLSLFTDCLSAEALFRVWDVVLCLNDGATFLFQVALALLKLNEKSLLRCESPAEVYGYINQNMTDHAISIDGLIRASEGLKSQVRREDVVERREKVVKQEEELAREREQIRKGKRRAGSRMGSYASATVNPVVDQPASAPLLAVPNGVLESSNGVGNLVNANSVDPFSLALGLELAAASGAASAPLPLTIASTSASSAADPANTTPTTTTTTTITTLHDIAPATPLSAAPSTSTFDLTTPTTPSSSSQNLATIDPLATPRPKKATPSLPRSKSAKPRSASRKSSRTDDLAFTAATPSASSSASRSVSRSTSRAGSVARLSLFGAESAGGVDGEAGVGIVTARRLEEEDEGEGGWIGELTVRTPMPIDEEVLWRG